MRRIGGESCQTNEIVFAPVDCFHVYIGGKQLTGVGSIFEESQDASAAAPKVKNALEGVQWAVFFLQDSFHV
jgi:hypothetical protein